MLHNCPGMGNFISNNLDSAMANIMRYGLKCVDSALKYGNLTAACPTAIL